MMRAVLAGAIFALASGEGLALQTGFGPPSNDAVIAPGRSGYEWSSGGPQHADAGAHGRQSGLMPLAPGGRYKMSGARVLRPLGISDDGIHTFMKWPPNVSLPAIYAVDPSGREGLANGGMRGGLYVVDSIEHRFVFRLDEKVARADRIAEVDGR